MKNVISWKESIKFLISGTFWHVLTIARLRQWFRQCVKYFAWGKTFLIRVVTPAKCPAMADAPSNPLPLHFSKSTFQFVSCVIIASVIALAVVSGRFTNPIKSSATSNKVTNAQGKLLYMALVRCLISHNPEEL